MKQVATINGITWIEWTHDEMVAEGLIEPVSEFLIQRYKQKLIRKEIEKAL